MGIEITMAPHKWMGGKVICGAKKRDKSSTGLCEFLPPSSSSLASKILSSSTHGLAMWEILSTMGTEGACHYPKPRTYAGA